MLKQYMMYSEGCFLVIAFSLSYHISIFVCFPIQWAAESWKFKKGHTLQFYNRLTGGFVRLHPDGTVDADGEKTDKYGKITEQSMWCYGSFGSWKEGRFLDSV